MEENTLLNLLKEIKSTNDKLQKDALIGSLYKELHSSGYKTEKVIITEDNEEFRFTKHVKGESSKEIPNHYEDKSENFIVSYVWSDDDLERIYQNLRRLYTSEDIEIKGSKNYYSLHQNDILSIMTEELLNLKLEKFNNDNQLRSYFKKRVEGECINKWNEINKIYKRNNSMVVSPNYYDFSEKESVKNYSSYEKMFNDKFGYYKNRYIREIDEELSEDERMKVYTCWARDILEGGLISMSTNEMGDIRKTEREFYWECLKKWREWATDNQIKKIETLLHHINDGVDIFKYEEEKEELEGNGRTFIYKHKYTLNKMIVGKLLFPNRKGNSNKDIDDFYNSLKKRFYKYYKLSLLNTYKIKNETNNKLLAS